nr:MAG TPA: hypothetical protein [Caudoviricetes sp.]
MVVPTIFIYNNISYYKLQLILFLLLKYLLRH